LWSTDKKIEFYFYFYLSPPTQFFKKISRKTFNKKMLAQEEKNEENYWIYKDSTTENIFHITKN
jgi:hypothetical protein